MESRTLRYRTNVPFCNACSEERDSHRQVILILKLAYRTNLSGWKLFFSWNILERSSENSKYLNERVTRNVTTDTAASKSNVLSRKVERQIPINVLPASLFYDGAVHSTGNAETIPISWNRGTPYNESDRRSFYPQHGSFLHLQK